MKNSQNIKSFSDDGMWNINISIVFIFTGSITKIVRTVGVGNFQKFPFNTSLEKLLDTKPPYNHEFQMFREVLLIASFCSEFKK